MNRVILVGRLTKDPELKKTNTDISVVQFSIAVDRNYVRNGEKQTDFINCVAWRQQADNLAKYMRKGSQIGLEGQLQVRTYDDINGQKRYITEVICDNIYFLESKSARNNGGYSDINSYDIPNNNNQVNKTYTDPFANIGGRSSGESNESSNDTKNPFENLKITSGVSDDDLPFE